MLHQKNMILKLIVYACLLCSCGYFCLVRAQPTKRRCLTGHMTDLQNWVTANGRLTVTTNAIDLSELQNVTLNIQRHLNYFRSNSQRRVQYLSLARCDLNRVPQVFSMRDNQGRPLSQTVRYISLYGNRFQDTSMPGRHYEVNMNATKSTELFFFGFPSLNSQKVSLWSSEFLRTSFVELLELDLRACSIQTLNDDIFKRMPNLRMLYLGENSITTIHANAFRGLVNLVHLDISNNLNPFTEDKHNPGARANPLAFRHLPNLVSLDLSFMKLEPKSSVIFRELGPKFERLSICETMIRNLDDGVFNNTNMKYLDVSGNIGIFNNPNGLQGIEDSLKVLYADSVGLQTLNVLEDFKNLQVLKASKNDVVVIAPEVAATWRDLRILDLTVNRIGSWWNATFSLIPKLSFLSLVKNNINLITEHMVKDMRNLDFIGLSRNFIVCNCHARELIDIARRNEFRRKPRPKYSDLQVTVNNTISFHTAFSDYDALIHSRIVPACDEYAECSFGEEDSSGNFRLFDYSEESYKCLAFEEATTVNFSTVDKCNHNTRDSNYDETVLDEAMNYLMLLIIPSVLLPVLALGFFFRRWFVYFCITMRNSAMLSLINNGDSVDAGTIFNYDVFVSYCNEDRAWVLDHLLPHVEKDCNVSVCLHERDFQVGLSILENIVSCMDRSKSIMLVISQKFLMSQWCQFEMHLAQHRLLETRREDLILVLLEKIPRHMRPNTLHYLMLTKTYIVWPKEKSERETFWKRLNKSLVTHRIKQSENVSLA